jgi:hypothetical protein
MSIRGSDVSVDKMYTSDSNLDWGLLISTLMHGQKQFTRLHKRLKLQSQHYLIIPNYVRLYSFQHGHCDIAKPN